MIICTKGADTLARRAFDAKEVAIGDFAQMLTQFSVDPTVSQPKKDAFIITVEDLRSPRVRQEFTNAVANKHEKTIIILIAKTGKSPINKENCPGLDALLMKPRPEDIKNEVKRLVSISADKTVVKSSGETLPEEINNPKPVLNQWDNTQDPDELTVDNTTEEPEPEPLPIPEPVPEPEPLPPTPVDDSPSMLVQRFKETGNVRDIKVLMRELTAQTVIKDLIDSNHTYASAEEKMVAIQNNIYAIMAGGKDVPLETKLNQVRALIHDKNNYAALSDTILEQRIQTIIDLLLDATSNAVEERLDEINKAIVENKMNSETQTDYARLAGITEERANLILELAVMSEEIVEIARSCDSMITESVGYMADRMQKMTGNSTMDARLQLEGRNIISDQTMMCIKSTLETAANDVPSEMKKLQLKVVTMLNTLNKLFDLDRDTIAAQKQYIDFLMANHIEDTITAQSLIKKSLRVFVGYKGSGMTIIPYLMSYYQSRQNANVLLVDLTGKCKASEYGIRTIDIEDYLQNRYESELCYVSGEVADNPAQAQRLITALTKAADYYRVINVVVDPDMRSLLEVFLPDVLCVNYLTDISTERLALMKDLIADTRRPNTAQRVIVNKCNISFNPLIEKLGLSDVMDIALVKIPIVDVMTDASINGYNPCTATSVALAMEEVLRNART